MLSNVRRTLGDAGADFDENNEPYTHSMNAFAR